MPRPWFTMSLHRREYLAQLRLALPILGGQLAQTANGFVDTVMAGRVSAADLAAVAVGASIWVPLFLFMTGVLTSATPVLARHLGGAAYHRVNPLAQQGLWLALGLGLLCALILRAMAPVLHLMDVDPAIRPLAQGYLDALSWGMPGAAVLLALRSYTEAMNHTRPVLLISVAGLLINIPANYLLIYGKLGLPALGGVGCGWATSLVMWSMALMMGGYIKRHPIYRPARLTLRQRHWEPASLGYLLRLGLPVGLSIFFEVSIFSVIALLISRLGPEVVAGHQVALNFTSLVFMLPLSFAIAATVRVGRARGGGDREALMAAVRCALLVTAAIGLGAGLLLVLTRAWIPYIYTDNARVIQLAAHLLLFAGLYQISDAVQVSANGCLRGFEDTAWPMVMTLVAYWGVGLPLGYVLGLTDLWVPAMGPAGFWIGLVAGLTTAAVLLSLRLRWRLRQPLPATARRDEATLEQAA
ncbi:MATE family efflux transporter [Alcanivorax marinus]|uniref:Multidrug-efflux transporter n=2 Tax=Alloalcanivorax marinus TaxID=1177169 RepID=A0A9Q3UI66_9GAMM|nr:MATE family efflux transporter [Alloalcanivorax marinus]MCC4307656.1 MATE family efflux transporter [Alloalcanivorax marinus]